MKQVKEFYINPELAKGIVYSISKNPENGSYQLLNDPKEFANRLSEDLV